MASSSSEGRPPCPPFSYEDALKKVRAAEDAWNSRDASKVKMVYNSFFYSLTTTDYNIQH